MRDGGRQSPGQRGAVIHTAVGPHCHWANGDYGRKGYCDDNKIDVGGVFGDFDGA
jgi:hypothetical protein